MKAILVRTGVDHSYGGWNAPADPATGKFVYVPIPEVVDTRFHRGCRRDYGEIVPALEQFSEKAGVDLFDDLRCPRELLTRSMHLDPDFEWLTYGDVGNRRGSHIRQLEEDDLLVFYAGLRPCRPHDHKLIYALTGLYVVDEVIDAAAVPRSRWNENAHTRKLNRGDTDIVVRAKPGVSGRFRNYLPIGEYRDRAYRVRTDVLQAWGGLSVNDGYIQRSARPPRFLDARRFRRWLDKQNVELLAENNPTRMASRTDTDRVIVVHLRQPRRSDPDEMRTDPFWEFGSFGCTGCHAKNLMNPRRIDELAGARLAFAQGGSQGFRLVMLTPPVEVVRHARICELRWRPAEMPFRYDAAPLLINNSGKTDVPSLRRLIRSADRSTWMGRFSSSFRSRRTSLEMLVAREIVQVYERTRRAAPRTALATHYHQALPYPPNAIDRDRERSYRRTLRRIGTHPPRRRCR
jgi:Nucleotide modification associated domain 3